MAVDGKGEVSACGHMVSEDLGFRNDGGASVSEEEEEIEIGSDDGDIMVGFVGADVYFDGIYDGQQNAGDDDDDEYRNYAFHIDQSLEITEAAEGGYGYYEVKESVGDKSDEIVSCVRALVQSLPDQISPQELVPVNPPSDHPSEETSGAHVVNLSRPFLKRKRETNDEEFVDGSNKHTSMPSSFQEFEDFLITSTAKCLPADKMISQHQMLVQIPKEQKQVNHTELLPRPSGGSELHLLSPVKDVKDSYWTDMVIQTGSPIIVNGSHDLNKQTAMLSAEDPNNCLRKKSHVPVAAATQDKYSPAELILTFNSVHTIPSESKLNNVFRRFGTLRETETVIYQESSCARVVFKRCSDAEVAVSSAKAFNIMGPSVIKYELSYSPPLLSYKVVPAVNVEKTVVVMQSAESEVTNALELNPEDASALQMQFQHVADETVESEEREELDDVDIMT